MPSNTNDTAALIGRVLIAVLFLLSGWSKVGGLESTAGYIAAKGLPFPAVLAGIALVLELVAGIAVLIGWKTRWAALLLALFMIVITPIFHDFWAAPANQAMNQLINFEKNVAILGGILVLLAFGPGRYSVDKG